MEGLREVKWRKAGQVSCLGSEVRAVRLRASANDEQAVAQLPRFAVRD